MPPELAPDQLPPNNPTPPIPPIDPPPTGLNDDGDDETARLRRQNDLITQILRDQNKTITELQREANRPPAEPPKSQEDLTKEYYADPVSVNRKLIAEELEKSVGPLREFVQGMRTTSQLDQFVDKYKNDVRFNRMWDSAVEQYIRREAGNVNPLNENVFGVIVMTALGMKASGLLGTPAPTNRPPAPSNMPPTRETPPYIPPTNAPPPPASGGPNGGNLRELTELEARLARENRMTKEEYLKWIDEDSRYVATSQIGKTPPPGGR